jgi:microcin C transport system permease protein
MANYIIRRLLLMIPTLLGITFIVFLIIQSAPGGPIEQAIQAVSGGSGGEASVSGNVAITEELLADLKKQYGFDKPIHIRYLLWMKNVVTFNFGKSLVYEEPVLQVIKSKFPVSLQFGLTALLFTYLFCIPLGIAKAVRDKSRFDYATSIFIFIAHSTPGFVLGILLVVFLGGGSFFNLFPIGDLHSPEYEALTNWGKLADRLHHAVLPLICYMVSHIAVITMLMKNSLINELSKDYIKTARAKGVKKFWVIYKHALRNALIPIATSIGNIFTVIFAGSLLIETVFNLDGMGLLTFNSVLKRDYTVIMASVTIHSFLIMMGNLFSDIILVVVDPRISYE